jgi:DNA-binding MarR family transcriptional regulator
MTTGAFDAIIHPRNRLHICAVLSEFDEVMFETVRDELDISDSVLSKQIAHLRSAGYVRVIKRTVDSRQRTWLALTTQGRRAFAAHIAELQRIAGVSGE